MVSQDPPLVKLSLPLDVHLPRKTMPDKKIRLNLNNYHTLHPAVRNQAKLLYCDQVANELVRVNLLDSPIGRSCHSLGPGPFKLVYTLFWDTLRRVDIVNVLAIVDKWALDALVMHRLFPDDNSDIFPWVTYRWGGVDRANPRAELEVKRL